VIGEKFPTFPYLVITLCPAQQTYQNKSIVFLSLVVLYSLFEYNKVRRIAKKPTTNVVSYQVYYYKNGGTHV
jgi:hypothetical protein